MTTAQKRLAAVLPTHLDTGEFSRLLADELDERLKDALGSKEDAGKVKHLVKTAIFITIKKLTQSGGSEKKQEEGSHRRKYRNAATGKEAKPLPVDNLTPTEVVDRGLVEMSLQHLYRATKDGRYYSATPRGKRIGMVYPAWQFEEPVIDMLPEVLSVLREQGEKYIHARMVTAEDELMELAPAEVLAGRLFNAGENLHPAQAALLRLPTSERLAKVKKVFGKPSREHCIG